MYDRLINTSPSPTADMADGPDVDNSHGNEASNRDSDKNNGKYEYDEYNDDSRMQDFSLFERARRFITKITPNPITCIENLDLLDDKMQNKHVSMEAKIKRRKKMLRAIYGEFVCTSIYFTCVFGVIANGYRNNWSDEFKVFTGN